ncbi:MAG: acyltransferase family protein [Acidimicrobiales bacterium]
MVRAGQDATKVDVDTGAGTLAPAKAPGRDSFIDFVRAFSLLVVVAWHWVFTIIVWRADGPHATNPIGFTRGMFVATWLLQVMPLFFFVGGFAHEKAWLARSDRTLWRFARDRALSLIRPALALAFGWWLVGTVVVFVWDVDGIGRAVRLILSPLWFLVVYVLLIALFPLAYRLHVRFGGIVLVWTAGLAALVDVIRFAHDVRWVAWFNMVLVWGLCHQLGFFWEQLVAAGRRTAWMLTWSGLFGLLALVGSGLYPGSMVGVPGERFSNMAPPTLCIVTLVFFQGGIALLLRPWVLDRLETSRRWSVTNSVINRFSLPLFLFHSTGMAVWAAFSHFVLDSDALRRPDAGWWLSRPFAFVGPLLVTLPIILLLAPNRRRAPAA